MFHILADATPVAEGNNLYYNFIFIGVAILFFYFMLIRPEQRRRKQLEALRQSLKKGDRVVAIGIIGTVWSVSKEEVILLSAGESKISVLPEAISQVLAPTVESE